MKKITLLFILSLTTASLLACGNEYEEPGLIPKPDYPSYSYGKKESTFLFTHGFDTLYLQNRKNELQQRMLIAPSYKLQSDIALIELKVGDRSKAIEILEALYAQYPKEYNIVANLGTAYEVTGEDQKAYKLLKEALAINPDSHHGSEWIHLRILEAKMFKTPFTVMQIPQGLSPSEYAIQLSDDTRHHYQLLKLMLHYQLKERISFIAPNDSIIGKLLVDMSDLAVLTGEVDHAVVYLDQALEYDPALQSIVNEKKSDLRKTRYIAFVKKYWSAAAYLLVLVGVGIFLYKKRNQDL